MHVVSANDDGVGPLALISSMQHSVTPYDNVRPVYWYTLYVCECIPALYQLHAIKAVLGWMIISDSY